jgi:uncharacterized protein YfaS (alpha-2-macroglobulin family)
VARFDVVLDSPIPRRHIAIEVPLPAGVRPLNLATDYGYRSPKHFGAAHHEYREDRVLLFLDSLHGTTRLSFWVVGNNAGRFQMAPASSFDMYDESVRATTEARWFHVAPADVPTIARKDDHW